MEAYSPPDGNSLMPEKKPPTRTRNTKVYKNPNTGNTLKKDYHKDTKAPDRPPAKGHRDINQLIQDMNYRRDLNKPNRQAELRAKFQVDEYIRQLKKADERLENIAKECTQRKGRMSKDEWNYYDSMVKIIKEQKDINFKRLAKVVGDVKAIELTDGDGKNPFTAFVGLFQQAMTEENQ
jgi:hypothetical protein